MKQSDAAVVADSMAEKATRCYAASRNLERGRQAAQATWSAGTTSSATMLFSTKGERTWCSDGDWHFGR